MKLPPLVKAAPVDRACVRAFIGAYGFEERSLGWLRSQEGQFLRSSLVFDYKNRKGRNKVYALNQLLRKAGTSRIDQIVYDTQMPGEIEDAVEDRFLTSFEAVDEIVLDITAQTKFLTLLCLCMLSKFPRRLRIVYTEARNYAPTYREYVDWKKEDIQVLSRFPSRGFQSIVRAKCLSSIRMQGQPVTLIAFASFNEQLVRHMLGTISPHRLLFVNGRPPRRDYQWRERATQEIHQKLIQESSADNPLANSGLLRRAVSTLDYRETVTMLHAIYRQYGTYERIICAATGSKMQTVGLFFTKMMHPDIHIEYPTPDSYFVKGMSTGVRRVYEVVIPRFSHFVEELRMSGRR